MSEAPEVPEAKDPFEKMVAVSIAIMAAMLAFFSMRSDNNKTDAIISKNEAVNKWAWYQAKSIKQNIAQSRVELMEAIKGGGLKAETIKDKIDEYKKDEEQIKQDAVKADESSERSLKVNDRCDLASLCLQIAIVISSVAILAHLKELWLAGVALGLGGIVLGITSFIPGLL